VDGWMGMGSEGLLFFGRWGGENGRLWWLIGGYGLLQLILRPLSHGYLNFFYRLSEV